MSLDYARTSEEAVPSFRGDKARLRRERTSMEIAIENAMRPTTRDLLRAILRADTVGRTHLTDFDVQDAEDAAAEVESLGLALAEELRGEIGGGP